MSKVISLTEKELALLEELVLERDDSNEEALLGGVCADEVKAEQSVLAALARKLKDAKTSDCYVTKWRSMSEYPQKGEEILVKFRNGVVGADVAYLGDDLEWYTENADKRYLDAWADLPDETEGKEK